MADAGAAVAMRWLTAGDARGVWKIARILLCGCGGRLFYSDRAERYGSGRAGIVGGEAGSFGNKAHTTVCVLVCVCVCVC